MFLLLCLLHSVQVSSVYVPSFSVEASTLEIRQISTLSFIFKTQTELTAGAGLTLTFPGDFTAFEPTDPVCAFQSTQFAAGTTCEFAGLQVSIPAAFASELSAGQWLLFDIQGIANPDFAVTTESFVIQTLSPAGAVVDYNNDTASLTFTPVQLPFAEIIPASAVTGSYTDWLFSLELALDLPVGSEVQITFPKWNANVASDSADFESFDTNGECDGSVSCMFEADLLTAVVTQATSGQFEFTLKQVRNPPSTQPVSGFRIRTLSSGQLIEDSQVQEISVEASEPGQLVDVSITPQFPEVSATTIYEFGFNFQNPMPEDVELIIQFADDFALNLTSVQGIFGFTNKSPQFTVDGQVLTILDAITTYKSNGFVYFTVENIKNPESVKPAGIVTLQTQTGEYLIEQFEYSGLTAASSGLNNVQILPELTGAGTLTQYLFEFELVVPIPASAYIIVTLPEGCQLDSNALQVGDGLSELTECEILSSQEAKLTNGFPERLETGSISFTLAAVRNPLQSGTFTPFEIELFTAENYIVSSASSGSVEIVVEELDSFLVTHASPITGESTTYTFELQPQHSIILGAEILIEFPLEVKLSSASCSGFSGVEATAVCEVTDSTVSVKQGFLVAESIDAISFTVQPVQNPSSLKPSSTFKAYVLSAEGAALQQIIEGVFVVMSELHVLVDASVEAVPSVVGAEAEYQFTITPYNPVPPEGKLTLTLPNEILVLSADTCSSVDTQVSGCSVTGQSIEITFTSGFDSEITVSVGPLVNPGSTQPVSGFTIVTSTEGYGIDQISSDVSVEMDQFGQLLAADVIPSSTLISADTVYTVSFTATNSVPAGGYLKITFPSDIQINADLECSQSVTVDCSVSADGSLLINLPEGATTASVDIATFSNSATSGESGEFTLTTLDSSSYGIDSLSNITVVFTCLDSCSTCQDSPTFCTSCVSAQPYIANNTCYDECPSGYAHTGDFVCEPCSVGCDTCLDAPDFCLTCESSYYFYNNFCWEECPASTLATVAFECEPCDLSCATCQDSVLNCTSCNSPQVLYGVSCLDECPANYTVEVDGVCTECSEPCLQCVETTTRCTECELFLFDYACYSECPADVSVQVGDECVACAASCGTCTNSADFCTSCTAGLYLFSGECVGTCPSGYYGADALCNRCQSPCSDCLQSATTCTSCTGTLLLYNSECVETCPEDTYPLDGKCLSCGTGCTLCSASGVCEECEEDYSLISDTCIQQCETGFFVNDQTCSECDSLCNSCSESAANCTSCASPLVLYENSCLEECPDDYILTDTGCILEECGCSTELLENAVCDTECNTKACNYDNDACETSESAELGVEQDPFILSSCAGLLIFGIGISSIKTGHLILENSLAVIGLTQHAGVLALVGVMNTSEGSRRLTSVGEAPVLGFFLILVFALGMHVLLGIWTGVLYIKRVYASDRRCKAWFKTQRPWSVIILGSAFLSSFNCALLFSSRFCNLQVCLADFANFEQVNALYSYYWVADTVLSIIPVILACSLFLSEYSIDSAEFMMSLDLLITSVLLLILTLIILHKTLSRTLKMKRAEMNTKTLSHVLPMSNGLELNCTVESTQGKWKGFDQHKPFSTRLSRKVYSSVSFEEPSEHLIDRQDGPLPLYLSDVDEELQPHDTDCISGQDTIGLTPKDLATDVRNSILRKRQLPPQFGSRRKNIVPGEFLVINEQPEPIGYIEDEDIIDLATAVSHPEHPLRLHVKHVPSQSVIEIEQGFSNGLVVDEDGQELDPQPAVDLEKLRVIEVDPIDVTLGTLASDDPTPSLYRVKRRFAGAKVLSVIREVPSEDADESMGSRLTQTLGSTSNTVNGALRTLPKQNKTMYNSKTKPKQVREKRPKPTLRDLSMLGRIEGIYLKRLESPHYSQSRRRFRSAVALPKFS